MKKGIVGYYKDREEMRLESDALYFRQVGAFVVEGRYVVSLDGISWQWDEDCWFSYVVLPQ